MIVIVEPDHTGHRYYFVALLCRHAQEPVVLITSEHGLTSREFEVHLAGVPLEVRTVPGRHETTAQRLKLRWEALGVAAGYGRDAHVVFPDLDLFLLPWTLHRRAQRSISRSTALLMRPTGADPTSDPSMATRIFCGAKTVALQGICRRGTAVHQLVNAFGEGQQPLDHGLPTLRDPASLSSTKDRQQARAELGLDAQRQTVLVAGHINRRKGTSRILDAFAHLTGPLLVVAGDISPEFRNDARLLRLVREGKAEVRDGYATNEQLDALIIAADLVLVVREHDEGPSGLLAQAAIRGRAVVTTGARSLARTVKQHGLGVSTDPEPRNLARGIVEALERQEALEQTAGRAGRVLQGSEAEFARALLPTASP